MGWVRALSIAALLLGPLGCTRDPMERVVSARTTSRLAAWRAHVASDYNVETMRRVEQALQEIRLNVTGNRELKRQLGESITSGTEVIDEAIRARVHGRRLREVLQLGYELRVRRLTEELTGLEDAMSKNAQLVTRPGDLASKHHLEGLQERQHARVEKYRADIEAAEKELAPLVAKSGKRSIELRTEAGDQLPFRDKK
jgi:hypothetical protein